MLIAVKPAIKTTEINALLATPIVSCLATPVPAATLLAKLAKAYPPLTFAQAAPMDFTFRAQHVSKAALKTV